MAHVKRLDSMELKKYAERDSDQLIVLCKMDERR
jgi:hypothetical protein